MGRVCKRWAGGEKGHRVRFLSFCSFSICPGALPDGKALLSGVRELLVWWGVDGKQGVAGAGALECGARRGLYGV